ncbi:MAG: beta-ketoacyl-ACP synthase II [Clostridiales Family XIII bacterium]|jgi:3-oxoacyl-[acyl-carrier-protein] synthase II|nr:beta-ketoacyl-ACP synthase II [Clostridiales Family XIII bacterium]
MDGKRVVITGIGAVCAVGNDVPTVWDNLMAGRHGFARIETMDITDHKISIGGEVRNFEYPDKREAKRLDLFCQFGLVAADEALTMSGIVAGDNVAPERVGVYLGSGIGGIRTLEKEMVNGRENGYRRVSALLVPMIIINILPGNVAIKYGFKGYSMGIVTACTSGTNAVGEGWRAIKLGLADVIVAGGGESPFAPVCVAGFANMKAMSEGTDPDRASIPFDKERNGFVMGEGAGALVLEEYEHAKARGANILAEVVGYGANTDAYHITQPSPSGEGAADSMRMALESAGIRPSDISYINAHGTSTPLNDLFETRAVKTVFGKAAYDIPMSSTKSMTGHALGAAGALEAVFLVKTLLENRVPPTAGYRVPDEELDLDYVTEGARDVDVKYAMSNSLGFGGHNGTIIFKKYE